uniref:F-box protein At5g49610 n=1 Tax=Anthurium amnicola TaxID=1678845 RepID=A0A1D1Y4N3_9ARAE
MESAGCPTGHLPDDLLVLILARLPVKALFRCRSVCRFFCNLPSDPHFARLHHRMSRGDETVMVDLREPLGRTHSTLACVDASGGLSELSLRFLNDRVRVRASCNGLLCCASVPSYGVYYVCNPVTREFRPLPRTRETPPNRYHPDDEATLVGLAFDPSESDGEFSVVLAGYYRPFGHRPFDRLVCLIYNSKMNAWRRFLSTWFDEFSRMNRNQVVFAGGSLHWLTRSCSYVLVLDLGDEVWRKISLPGEIASGAFGASRVYLLEFEGAVSVVQMSEAWMCTWVLEDYEREKWVLVDRLHLRCIMGFVPSAFPVSQTRDAVFMATQSKIFVYDRKSKVWKEIFAVKDTDISYPLWFSAQPFRSTLLSFNQGLQLY